MKRAKKARIKRPRGARRTKPRSVWNPLRKLENYLRKADLQADIFMESLNELREVIAFEVKSDFVRRLCNSVHGDLLGALWNHRKMREESQAVDGENKEVLATLDGVLDVLVKYFSLRPCKSQGERFSLSRESLKEFEFDEVPESLGDPKVRQVEVEVLRCGWKIGEKVIQKPKVFEVSSS